MRKALALLALLLMAGAAQAAPTAWDRVWRSEAAPQRVSIEGRVRTMMSTEGRTRRAEAVARVAHGKMRFDYELRGRHWSLIDDGHNLIALHPAEQEATVMPRPEVAFDRSLAERNYIARVTGTARIAGRRTDVVEIRPRARGPVVRRLWLDRQTALALKRERYNADGKLISSTEYLALHPSDVPADAFSIPAGWKREDRADTGPRLSLEELSRRLGLEVRPPGQVPAGYALLGSYLGASPRGRHPVAALRYTDGLRMLSVVERTPGRGRGRRRPEEPGRPRRSIGADLTIIDRGNVKALRYQRPDRVVWVVGDLTEGELVRVAKSVE